MSLLQNYLSEVGPLLATGVAETSYYPALSNLLNGVGKTLRPGVRCVIHPKSQGAGLPDGGFFTPDQYAKADEEGLKTLSLKPSRGVLEAKGVKANLNALAASAQVNKYLEAYGQVLVTNLWEFALIGRGADGAAVIGERLSLAKSEAAFRTLAANPSACPASQAEGLDEYLRRVLLSAAPLASPQDVAWFLASYARDAKRRVEAAGVEALRPVREALEKALGLTFTGDRGLHFFQSTLVQTLFYGMFSAWVLWCRGGGPATGQFQWRQAAYELHVPMIQALFEEVSKPSRLRQMGLVEVLDWAGAALNRVDREAFFSKFDQGQAVQYFYEPFLEAFDPSLRKELGVWYTPPEIVQYMVARVDRALREELGLPDGLADERVVVLDPCCGTGAYLVEVLRVIRAILAKKGDDALAGSDLRQAALSRVFGFEILTAPFVVAHLQLAMLLQEAGAPLSHHGGERAGVYLTNALTGWEPSTEPKLHLPLPEFEAERDAAEEVKQNREILVILGNPPYNSFAGVAMDEERTLSEAYRGIGRDWKNETLPRPQGQGLNDLYIRFFRMAERRIAEKTGRGVVCFISNYSWLDGLSHTVMREKYLDVFDKIWIDSLNGDKYRTGKTTPEGLPDPSAFSTEFNREGIQVGTAIATLVKNGINVTQGGGAGLQTILGQNQTRRSSSVSGRCRRISDAHAIAETRSAVRSIADQFRLSRMASAA